MLDEGVARAVAQRKPRRRTLPFWGAALVAPVLAYVFGASADQVVYFERARAFGAWYGPTWPQPPVVGVHPSLAAWLVGAALAILLCVRLAADRRTACSAIAVALAAPLAYGNVHDWWLWRSATRVTADVQLVAACAEADGSGGHVAIGDAFYRVEASTALRVTGGALVRASDARGPAALMLRLAPGDWDALASHSRARVVADAHCGYDVLVVNGRPLVAARVRQTLLWGAMSLSDPDAGRLREILGALTTP